MGKIVEEIKFGILTDAELFFLKSKVEREQENRKRAEQEKSDKYVDVIYADDGSEGFYCPVDKWHKIPSEQLHGYISQTLQHGSSITFTRETFELKEYQESAARYEWRFEDGENTEVIEENDEE